MDESLLDTMFMELASESRRSMLHILEQRNEKLSKIAESLDITIQEAHRNSARLTKCGLINKNSDGLFHLTSLGHILINRLHHFHFQYSTKIILKSIQLEKSIQNTLEGSETLQNQNKL